MKSLLNSQSSLANYKGALSLLVFLLSFGIGEIWGAEVVYKTALFGSSYNSRGVSGYTDVSFSSTNNGFTVNVENANNNNNGWDYIKIGGKNGAYTGTITTAAAIDKAITKVMVKIDAITSSNVTSITLYTSSNGSSWSSVGTFTKSTGSQSVSLSSPAANLYYKIEAVCTKGSSNGLLTISQIDYYYDASCTQLSAPGDPSSIPSSTSVALSWNSVANSSGYLLTFDGTEYNIASGTTTQTITGLAMEKTYTWTVAAKGDGTTYCAQGTATSEQSVTTLDNCSGNKATYTVTSTSAVSTSGAPVGTTASYSSTYDGTVYQLTGGNSMTLTLSGYEGKVIKGLTLSMKSNASAGAGTFSMSVGSTTVAAISEAATFNKWYDNTSFGSTYRNVHVTLISEEKVKADENIVITIAATVNSLYCESFAVCYADAPTSYNVTYDDNDATGGSVPTDSKDYDENDNTVTVLGNTGNMTKTGWTFAGWNTEADGSGTTYSTGNTFTITDHITLYAKWMCTVTWSVNEDASICSPETITYNPSGSRIGSVPTIDPADYCGDKFIGWTNEVYTGDIAPTGVLFKRIADSPDITGNVTFYAVFADYVTP